MHKQLNKVVDFKLKLKQKEEEIEEIEDRAFIEFGAMPVGDEYSIDEFVFKCGSKKLKEFRETFPEPPESLLEKEVIDNLNKILAEKGQENMIAISLVDELPNKRKKLYISNMVNDKGFYLMIESNYTKPEREMICGIIAAALKKRLTSVRSCYKYSFEEIKFALDNHIQLTNWK